jgi:hypothetical protein
MIATVRHAPLLVAAGLLSLSLLAGCSGGAAARNAVKGKLTNAGKPLEFDPMFGSVQLNFVPMKGNKRPPASALPEEEEYGGSTPAPPGEGTTEDEFVEVYPAQVLPTGEYYVDGGIPDGMYLVTVRHFPKGKQFDLTLDQQDTLKGQFSIYRSPIVREIKGSQQLDVELRKPKG